MENVSFETGKQILQEARYAIVAVYCLQLYEWLDTASKEVDLIHRARWTSIKVAYLLCRYYTLLIWPLVMFAYVGNHTWEFCNHLGTPVHILLAPCQLFPQGVMVMRAYAFSGRSRRVLAILLICYGGLFAVDVWAFCLHITVLPRLAFFLLGGTGCYPYYGKGVMGFRIGYSMLAATLMDLISLVIVLLYCFRKRNREVSLAKYFVSQGLVAFGLVSGVNIATAFVFFNQTSPHNGLGLPFILVVSNLIACRIILNLRRRVTPTESEIVAQHSLLVREALVSRSYDSEVRDSWVMEEEERT